MGLAPSPAADRGVRRAATLVMVAALTVSPALSRGEVVFSSTVIDAGHSGDCKALADLNGDGLADAVVAGYEMKWYEAPDWTARVIDTAADEFTTDLDTADLDGDGDNDIVVPDGATGVYWYENGSRGTTWTRRAIGTTGGEYCHDVAIGDIDGDGDLDVVGRPLNGDLYIFRRESGGGWTIISRATVVGEGLALADLDGDGRLDIVVNGQWHEAPGGNIITDAWPRHIYDAAKTGLMAKVAVADLNGDGRPDIALTPSEGLGEIAWYEAPPDPKSGLWTRHVLESSADQYHSLQLIDVDGDGWRDLLTAQMHTVVGTPVVAVYMNPGVAGGTWPCTVIAQTSSHNLAVGDVNGDGRPDLLGSDYIGNPPVTLWLNRTMTASALPLPTTGVAELTVAPNPFNARIKLTMTGAGSGPATLVIYDLRGHLVKRLAQDVVLAGSAEQVWDGRGQDGRQAPSGTYFAVLTTGPERITRKLALVK